MPTQSKNPRTPQAKKAKLPLGLKPTNENAAQHPSTPAKAGSGLLTAPAVTTPGATVSDYETIQRDEVEVLKSIFMDDYEHVEKTGAWNVSTPTSACCLTPARRSVCEPGGNGLLISRTYVEIKSCFQAAFENALG